jgi:hypothetical protein
VGIVADGNAIVTVSHVVLPSCQLVSGFRRGYNPRRQASQRTPDACA